MSRFATLSWVSAASHWPDQNKSKAEFSKMSNYSFKTDRRQKSRVRNKEPPGSEKKMPRPPFPYLSPTTSLVSRPAFPETPKRAWSTGRTWRTWAASTWTTCWGTTRRSCLLARLRSRSSSSWRAVSDRCVCVCSFTSNCLIYWFFLILKKGLFFSRVFFMNQDMMGFFFAFLVQIIHIFSYFRIFYCTFFFIFIP